MDDQNREHKRLVRPLMIQFCIADALPRKWDMSVIENISAGGVKFKVPADLDLIDRTIQLRIRIPELAPHLLELEAVILDTQNSLARAKFINLSDENKEHLSIVERMVDVQKVKK